MGLELALKCMWGPVAGMGWGPTPAPPLRFNAAMSLDHCVRGLRAPFNPMPSRAASHALGKIGIRLCVVVLRSVISRTPRAAG